MFHVIAHYALVTVTLLFLIIIPVSSPGSDPRDDYKKLQKEMLEQRKKLKDTQMQESSVLNEIQDVNVKLGRILAELRTLRRNLGRIKSQINSVQTDIEKTRKSIEKHKEWIGRKLRTMNKYGYSGDILILLLSSVDMSQIMRTWKYLDHITRYEHSVLVIYQENLRNLGEKNRELEGLKTAMADEQEKIRKKEVELAAQKQNKETILLSVRHKKASHQKMLAELEDASKRLLELIREAERTDTYAGKGFSRLKGKLPWPVPGTVALKYGAQKDPDFDTPVFRNGIHIQTDDNIDANAVYKGKVIFAEWFKGFGQLVIINHGDGYHTLYGNLSEIFSRVGDIIERYQVIGKVGTSGLLNSSGMYFEIRYKGKPLDPTQWLQSKGR